ncbi:acyltransferase [Frateuria soli]|uniref:acyltransferase n=1 Tax=Frateuria soli TaxID=1542730 RepID=UPI001E2A3229|nr:acyltransferase [Frateuria soli]UGB38980.1 acyltransferase [Frateuria soli]
MSSHLTRDELREAGFLRFGDDVRVSRKASFYGAERILLGSHVRIDDFCVLSAGEGGIEIGDRIHIAVYSSLIGCGRIRIHDFANISSRVSIYSSNDDYSGETMTNPMVPQPYTAVRHADVSIGRHVIIGSGSVVLPGVEIGEGVAIGALSLVRSSCEPFGIYAGTPARRIGERRRTLLELERKLAGEEGT